MSETDSTYYYLAPGVDAVPLENDELLFRGDTFSIRIQGGFARVLRDRVLPLLDGRRSLAGVLAALPDLPAQTLRQRLDELVQSQVLRGAGQPRDATGVGSLPAPFVELLAAFGMPAETAQAALGSLRIGIAGLEGPGGHLAGVLAACGVGNLLLLDPYPCEPGNLALLPGLGPEAVGVPRQQAVQRAIQAQGGRTTVEVGPDGALTRETIGRLVPTCHLMVGLFDRGFAATNHWLNRAGLAHTVPSLYAEIRGLLALIGPLVLPGQTACYMCYRMRSLACEDDFGAAMSYEEFLDREKRPALHTRGVLPALPPYVGGVLAMEILKHCLALGQPVLAGRLLEFNTLTLQSEIHPVLQKPDCPVCGQKKNRSRPHPLMGELSPAGAPGDLLAAAPDLVSARTGVVRSLVPVKQDPSEPAAPIVLGAELSNNRFLDKEPPEQRICSGKGLTFEAARISTLGEAVERYSGTCWGYDEIVYARQADLPGPSLDPRELVLYTPEQYARLPYRPYTGENVLGWVRACSLVRGVEIFVPAQGVFMSYVARPPDETLCAITSNGLAAGATLAGAILGAACEVLERDAFMITWLNKLSAPRVDPWTHPDSEVIGLCEAYRRRDVAIELYHLPVDHPCHVCMALGVQGGTGEGPAVVVGLGADLEPAQAARKAVLEVGQVRPNLRRRLRQPETQTRLAALLADPHEVTTLEDHDLLYASRAMLPALDFLRGRPVTPFAWEGAAEETPFAQLEHLVGHLGENGQDLIYCNLTPPDMAAFGLYTVRVIVPGFQPIAFGAREQRLGGRRLYELPARLGYRPARTTLEQIYGYPHPLA